MAKRKTQPTVDEMFLKYWDAYPVDGKAHQDNCYSKWKEVTKHTSPNDFIRAAKNYRDHCTEFGIMNRGVYSATKFLSPYHLKFLELEVFCRIDKEKYSVLQLIKIKPGMHVILNYKDEETKRDKQSTMTQLRAHEGEIIFLGENGFTIQQKGKPYLKSFISKRDIFCRDVIVCVPK